MKAHITIMLIASSAILSVTHAQTTKIAAEAREEKLPKKIGRVSFEGGNGETMETAIVIKNAKNTEQGIDAEAKWVQKVHKNWKKEIQVLLSENGKHYDKITYKTPKGETRVLYFDITDFFGKI